MLEQVYENWIVWNFELKTFFIRLKYFNLDLSANNNVIKIQLPRCKNQIQNNNWDLSRNDDLLCENGQFLMIMKMLNLSWVTSRQLLAQS